MPMLVHILLGFLTAVKVQPQSINHAFAWKSGLHNHTIRSMHIYKLSIYIISNSSKWS